jgi:hypothetical protein
LGDSSVHIQTIAERNTDLGRVQASPFLLTAVRLSAAREQNKGREKE